MMSRFVASSPNHPINPETLPPIPDDKYGYELALHMAGAQIHAFEEFGSYQGDWWAKVTFNGQTGWVNGSYGSCSACDSFQAEFDWDDKNLPGYAHKLAQFGRQYLDGMMSQEEAQKEASRNIEWDVDAGPMLAFIVANA